MPSTSLPPKVIRRHSPATPSVFPRPRGLRQRRTPREVMLAWRIPLPGDKLAACASLPPLRFSCSSPCRTLQHPLPPPCFAARRTPGMCCSVTARAPPAPTNASCQRRPPSMRVRWPSTNAAVKRFAKSAAGTLNGARRGRAGWPGHGAPPQDSGSSAPGAARRSVPGWRHCERRADAAIGSATPALWTMNSARCVPRHARTASGAGDFRRDRRYNPLPHAPVAQLDRALASGAKGPAFESRRARQSWSVRVLPHCA